MSVEESGHGAKGTKPSVTPEVPIDQSTKKLALFELILMKYPFYSVHFPARPWKSAMMTMTMMQKLLQSEDRNGSSASNDAETYERKPPFESHPYQYTDKELTQQNQLLFLKTFSPNNLNQHLLNNNLKFERGELRKPLFKCDEVGHAFQEYNKSDSKTDDECANDSEKTYDGELSRRLSCDSEDSAEVNGQGHTDDDRVTSEEESNACKDRSPVDLTNRRLLEENTFDRQSAESITEESTLDSCKNDTRRLAFSVENILDPNKFTGKQLEDSIKEKLVQPYNWRPHIDYIDSSPAEVSRAGKCTIFARKKYL